MTQYKVTFADVDWASPMPGVRHKIVVDGETKLRLVEYYPEMAPHWCEVGHFGQILDGRFEIEFAESTQIFVEGDGVMIPAGAEHRHKARALTDVVRAVFVEQV